MKEINKGVDECGVYYAATPFNHDAPVKENPSKEVTSGQPDSAVTTKQLSQSLQVQTSEPPKGYLKGGGVLHVGPCEYMDVVTGQLLTYK